MIGFDDLGHWLAGGGDAEPLGRGVRSGRVMTQRLPEPAHSVILQPGTNQYRDNLASGDFLFQVLVDFFLRGLDVFEQLFEKLVVEIGEFLDQASAGIGFGIPEVRGQLNQVRSFTRLVFVGALAEQVDIAGDAGFAVA